MSQDLRYGLRMLWKNPGFTVVAVIALALGIGANTAIFSVVNAVLLRPLPYEESARLVILSERSPQLEGMSISYPNFTDWRQQNGVFEQIAVFRRQSYNLTGTGEPERLTGGQVSADLFPALRVKPALGRAFRAEEDQPGGEPVAILSHGLWQRRFGGDPQILGRALVLSGRSYSVVGVMPEDFNFPSRVELWTPVGQESGQPSWQNRGNHPGLYGVARLKGGVTIDRARAEMDAIAARLEQQYPQSNTGNRVSITPALENVVRDIRPALLVLLGAVGCVLLISCANVANLLLARAAARQKEMAIRTALGAGRWRVVRQLLTESLLLALLGGGLGLLLARWGVRLILAVSPDSIPRAREIGLDGRVLGFTLLVSLLTGVIFGLVPAWQASKPDLNETLKDAGRGSTGGLRRQRFRSALVVAEVALALVLLVGGGLLIRSFYRLQQVNPGFRPERLLTFQVALPSAKYSEDQPRINFYNQTLERLGALPGVESVGAATGLPLGNNGWQTSFAIEGRPDPPPGQRPLTETAIVTTDYFRAMGMTLVKGRAFGEPDRKGSPPVTVIDERFAELHFPNEDPIGKGIRFGGRGGDNPVTTVVGVIRRVKMEGLATDSNRVQSYRPYLQQPANGMTVVMRAAGDPGQLAQAARQHVLAVDPDLPIFNVRTMERIWDDSVAPQRLNTLLLGIFGGVALLLAAVGIYGVMSYSVTQRTHELGIRMALGARPRDVRALVVRQGMTFVALGVGLGLAGALVVTRWMASLLYGVSASDPLT
ncbi:MAG TPA: ABC transporter permease, partial [Blastocatellia bacterium]|nr:ABC transporter permease [Blastocatellia bacterium]